jgi:hypothetical protein
MSNYDDLMVSTEIHEKPVQLADGTTRKLYFRELPADDYRRFQIDESSDDEDKRAGSVARMIAASMCEPDGKPALTVEQARKLKPHVSRRLFETVLSLNEAGKKGEALPPGEKSGSGTSSPLPSAADPSQSGNAESPSASSSAGESSTGTIPSTTGTDTTGPQA